MKILNKNIRIFQLKENLKLPTEQDHNVMANCGIGDYIIIIQNESVYAKNWNDDDKHVYVLLAINPEFILNNTNIFNEID